MWTPTTRRQHSRAGLRYETDLTDAEWAIVEPLLPEPASCGQPPLWPMREILNRIFYVLRGGIAWRLLPKDLPPKSTVFGYFSRWRDTGVSLRINHHLVMADRERVGRDASLAATQTLSALGVDLHIGPRVVGADESGFSLKDGGRIEADLMVWAAGVKAPPVLSTIEGLERSKTGRLIVGPTLQTTNDKRSGDPSGW
jgi:transposase